MNKSFNIHDARFDRQISSSDRPFPIDRYSMVSLQYLDSIADPEAHCPVYTGMLAMIINIRSSKDYKTKSKVYSRGKTSSSEEEEKSYDKMISLMCFGSQPGQNACIVLAKGGATDRLFESNVARRDSPNHNGFGPGAWVFLKKPEVITAHFGDPEKGIPVLQFEPPFLLVDKVVTPFTPEPVPVRRITSKLACFFLTKCHIEIRNFSIVYVKCKGEFCDAVDILYLETPLTLKGAAPALRCIITKGLSYTRWSYGSHPILLRIRKAIRLRLTSCLARLPRS